MWNWIKTDITTAVLFIAFVATLCYALWLRSKMTKSKAQFALTGIASIISFATVGLHFLYRSGPFKASSTIFPFLNDHTGITIYPPDWLDSLLGFFIVIAVLILSYAIVVRTI